MDGVGWEVDVLRCGKGKQYGGASAGGEIWDQLERCYDPTGVLWESSIKRIQIIGVGTATIR